MKKVVWGEGKFTARARPGQFRSLAEAIANGEAVRAEQEKAQSYLHKAYPAMLKLLEIRIQNGDPLTVMRPLRYTTSCLKSELEDDLDKSFYNNSKSSESDRYVTVTKVINPGTKLILKALDPSMSEFVFVDGANNEHCVSYDERNSLLTQTDIFETIRNLMEGKRE